MSTERTPERTPSLTGDGGRTTPWELARRRLAEREPERTEWIATIRPDGRPHLMPLIAAWVDGALHFIAGEGTRKARNLAEDGRCTIGMSSHTLPSLDLIVEGTAAPLDDPDEVQRVGQVFTSVGWPLEARGTEIHGPNAPTAGPPPYRIFRLVPSTVYGLPGTFGMDQFQPDELPAPTRWDFGTEE